VVVVIFHDHGTRYVGKMFNDDWMRERGFLVEEEAYRWRSAQGQGPSTPQRGSR
jgi:hypothetical protein